MGAGFLRAWAVVFAAVAFAVPAAADPVGTAITLVDHDGQARLSIELSAEVDAAARVFANPDQVAIDLPDTRIALSSPPQTPAPRDPRALVQGIRYGALEPGKARVVLDLAERACVTSFSRAPKAGGGATTLTIEMAPCDERKFADAVGAPALVAKAAAAVEAKPPPVIVLDPGHGGIDNGAHGPQGAIEKSIVFDFAMALKKSLEATGRYKIVMTRQQDDYVSLEDRVHIAEDAGAALMISIHADTYPTTSASVAADVFGTTVYTCSDRASDAAAARVAARENAADRAGHAKSPDEPGVADILYDLKRRETRAYAHLFSRSLVAQWRGVGRLNRNPQRSAGFFVLKAPDYPSVLVELGYLSNPQDVANMTDAAWRDRAVLAMTEAIDRFFSPEPRADGASAKDAVAASDRAGESGGAR